MLFEIHSSEYLRISPCPLSYFKQIGDYQKSWKNSNWADMIDDIYFVMHFSYPESLKNRINFRVRVGWMWIWVLYLSHTLTHTHPSKDQRQIIGSRCVVGGSIIHFPIQHRFLHLVDHIQSTGNISREKNSSNRGPIPNRTVFFRHWKLIFSLQDCCRWMNLEWPWNGWVRVWLRVSIKYNTLTDNHTFKIIKRL
jgi:hypothetical protein